MCFQIGILVDISIYCQNLKSESFAAIIIEIWEISLPSLYTFLNSILNRKLSAWKKRLKKAFELVYFTRQRCQYCHVELCIKCQTGCMNTDEQSSDNVIPHEQVGEHLTD